MPKKTLAINLTPFEHRFAYLEDGKLQELYIEDPQEKTAKIGDIYHAKIDRALPGLGGAFLALPDDSKGFLQASAAEQTHLKLRQGDSIIVQVTKEATATKGPQLSPHLTFATENVVLLYKQPGVVRTSSQLKASPSLKDATEWAQGQTSNHGLLLRTRATQVSLEQLQQDWSELSQKVTIFERTPKPSAPAHLQHTTDSQHRLVKEWGRIPFGEVICDDQQPFPVTPHFLLQATWKHYTDSLPLFETLGIEKDIQTALQKRVNLPSGGSLVIETTEALTSIDVNTARALKGQNLQETIVQTNLEACLVISQQIRLRNLAGIIVLDFIDMLDAKNRAAIESTFREAMTQDAVPHRILAMNEIGLIHLTRKRQRPSLTHLMTTPCRVCSQSGLRPSIKSQCIAAYRKIQALLHKHPSIEVRAPQAAVQWFRQAQTQNHIPSNIDFIVEGHEIQVKARPPL